MYTQVVIKIFCDFFNKYWEQNSNILIKTFSPDPEQKERFEGKLLTMPTSEAIYLLTTFSKMAAAVSSNQKEFIQVIASEIYEVLSGYAMLM